MALSNHRGESAQADPQRMNGEGLHLVSPFETPTPTQLFSLSPVRRTAFTKVEE
jgi:hypothetical protein